MRAYPIAFLLTLPACSSGHHVEPITIPIVKYSCQYSPSVFKQDRRIAICDTAQECSKVCEENRQKEGQ